MTDFGFYLVMTNPIAGYASCAEAAVRAEVPILQLRMKHCPRTEILETARIVRQITQGSKTLFIVNDDPEIAATVEADGVHLGQEDMPLSLARQRYPDLKYFGLSTHNPQQVREARLQHPDYIGVGPVYPTPTKDIPDPTLGLTTLREMLALAPCPAVAIGGIDASRLKEVIRAGAKNLAVVRAVCQSSTPYATIQQLMRDTQLLWEQAAAGGKSNSTPLN